MERQGEAVRVRLKLNHEDRSFLVSEAKGTKCPRCWKHSVEANGEGLCPRCAAVLAALPELA